MVSMDKLVQMECGEIKKKTLKTDDKDRRYKLGAG